MVCFQDGLVLIDKKASGTGNSGSELAVNFRVGVVHVAHSAEGTCHLVERELQSTDSELQRLYLKLPRLQALTNCSATLSPLSLVVAAVTAVAVAAVVFVVAGCQLGSRCRDCCRLLALSFVFIVIGVVAVVVVVVGC